MKSTRKIVFLPLLLAGLALLTAGCSPAADPQPVETAKVVPLAVYPAGPPYPHTVTVYNLTLELEVSNVQAAAAEAARLSATFGGSLVTSQNWFENGQSVAFLEFAVPDGQSARLHSALLQLGRLTAENYATYAHDCLSCRPFSHISLYLRSARPLLSPLPAGGWDPLRTLHAALGVFTRIFGFLADLLIWLVVVAGPFILIGWGLVILIRRLRKGAAKPETAGPAVNREDDPPA